MSWRAVVLCAKNAYVVVLVVAILIVGASHLTAQNIFSDESSKSSVCFSPDGGIKDKIIAKINLSKKSIKIAIYSFTSADIAWALDNAKNRGVDIAIIADKSQSTGKNSEIPFLISKNIKLKILQGKGRGIMHNKFAIFDGQEVVTGSYNWTNNAELYNYENAIFICNPEAVNKFLGEFNRMWEVGVK